MSFDLKTIYISGAMYSVKSKINEYAAHECYYVFFNVILDEE